MKQQANNSQFIDGNGDFMINPDMTGWDEKKKEEYWAEYFERNPQRRERFVYEDGDVEFFDEDKK